MNKPFSLSKLERLKSKKDIYTLFLTGKAFFVFPFKIYFLLKDADGTEYPSKFGASVPKKIFKHAVDRNRLKRLMREIFRTNKLELNELLVAQQKRMDIMMVYTHKEILLFHELMPAVELSIKKLKHSIQN